MTRSEALDAVKKIICQDRQDVHGNPEDTHSMIAFFWDVYLSHRLGVKADMTSQDVAVMMCLFKIARHAMNPTHQDNLLDLIGYAAIAVEIADEES